MSQVRVNEEAAPEPGSSVLEVPPVPSRGQEGKQTVVRMEGLISNECCSLELQLPVDVSNNPPGASVVMVTVF